MRLRAALCLIGQRCRQSDQRNRRYLADLRCLVALHPVALCVGRERLCKGASRARWKTLITQDDVRCNVLNVGPLEIPIVDRLLRGDDFSHVLLARPVKAVEVAETIAFLCGPASAYITGAVLPVDGGASSVA